MVILNRSIKIQFYIRLRRSVITLPLTEVEWLVFPKFSTHEWQLEEPLLQVLPNMVPYPSLEK